MGESVAANVRPHKGMFSSFGEHRALAAVGCRSDSGGGRDLRFYTTPLPRTPLPTSSPSHTCPGDAGAVGAWNTVHSKASERNTKASDGFKHTLQLNKNSLFTAQCDGDMVSVRTYKSALLFEICPVLV